MAISGHKRMTLTLENVLSKVDEYSLYRYYLGFDFKLNKAFCNPFRNDKHPSMSVFCTSGGFLYHIDYANDYYRGTITDLLKQVYGFNFNEALKKIDMDFGLGLSSFPVKDYKSITSEYKKPKMEVVRDTLIQVKVRKFRREELDYWNMYGISQEELKENNIYAPKEIFINRFPYRILYGELCFCYLFEDKHWKIYRPHALDKKEKWRSNVPIDTMYGLSNVRNCEKAVITKSLKDYIILRKFMHCVCGVQNESEVAINKTNLEFLKQNCKEIYINFDNDSTGVIKSTYYTTNHGFNYINIPKNLLQKGIKDVSDLAKHYGLLKVEELLKSKKLI